MTSSNASLTCRLEWRPSRLLQCALLMLGLLAALSLWLSALPRVPAIGLGLMSVVGALRMARAEAARPACSLVWQAGIDSLVLNFGSGSESWHSPNALFRGPLASLSGRDAKGRAQRLLWWPDTLDARGRRSLRLAASEWAHGKTSSPSP